jgi:hypothetical protein
MNNANQNWAGNHQRSSGYTSGQNTGYGGYQQRWQGDRFHYRARDNGPNLQSRSGIDSDLLHQTVQAVVAAVTAATKVSEQSVPTGVTSAATLTGGAEQNTSVAAPTTASQPTQVVQATQGASAKGKENDGQGPQKKKKEEKSRCFRCKQP